MYQFIKSLLSFLLVFCSALSFAQCPTCNPDPECVSPDGFPAICPFISPPATVGAYYEEVLTFFLPEQITDPGSGVEATLLSVTITSVTGLPYGLVFTLNDADNTYYPADGDNLGCATICGTPVLPGIYNTNITVSALVIAFGLQITQSETFIYTIEVLPGEGSSSSFTYSNPAGCDQVTVEYNASIEFPFPTVVEYAWDFGNGVSGSGQSPTAVTYNEIGSYTASLITTVYEHELNDIAFFSVNDNWNDFEDIISEADIYFIITDGESNAVYTSETISNDNSPSWSELLITLSNPPYSIAIYDSDDISADDVIGSFELIVVSGSKNFSIDGNTNGNITINFSQTSQLEGTAEIIVFNSPEVSSSVIGNTISVPSDDTNIYTWYLNGSETDNGNSPTLEMIEGGLYYCVVTNSFGCTSQTSSYLFCPEITPEYDLLAMEVSVPAGFDSYQWFFNGLEVVGANSFYFPAFESGNYSVAIQTSYGCSTLSGAFVLNLSTDHLPQTEFQPLIYPSLLHNELFISQSLWKSNQPTVRFFDLAGKVVLANTIKNTTLNSLDTSHLSCGIYILVIEDADQYYRTKVVKK